MNHGVVSAYKKTALLLLSFLRHTVPSLLAVEQSLANIEKQPSVNKTVNSPKTRGLSHTLVPFRVSSTNFYACALLRIYLSAHFFYI